MPDLPAKLANLAKARFQTELAEWDDLLRPRQAEDYFVGAEDVPYPQAFTADRCDGEAWWLANLCRIAYTPDDKEEARLWNANRLKRQEVLDSVAAPLCEYRSAHAIGNHISIYRSTAGCPTIVCFRGTSKLVQWLFNATVRPHRWRRYRQPGEVDSAYVHSGFYAVFKRVWPVVWPMLEDQPRPWLFTGHSLGGALAIIAGHVAKADKVVTYGSPKVGNEAFCQLLDEALPIYRYVHGRDLVPHLPTNDIDLGAREFCQVGEQMWLEPPESTPATIPEIFRSLAEHDKPGLPPSWITDHRMSRYCSAIHHAVTAEKG